MNWEKIKAYAIANPKIAAFSIFLDLFFIGSWVINGFFQTLMMTGIIGMIVVGVMSLYKWLDNL